MNSSRPSATRRNYRQAARAEAAEINGRRIVEVFQQALREQWLEDITLDQVARDAGVSVQTVIRRYGGKQGLLEAVAHAVEREARRARVPQGDLVAAVANLCADYEQGGEMLLRLLFQEPRYPVLSTLLNYGRAQHRDWVAEVAEPWLVRIDTVNRQRALDALVAAMDVYVWRLVRHDIGRSVAETGAVILRLAQGALKSFLPDAHDPA